MILPISRLLPTPSREPNEQYNIICHIYNWVYLACQNEWGQSGKEWEIRGEGHDEENRAEKTSHVFFLI